MDQTSEMARLTPVHLGIVQRIGTVLTPFQSSFHVQASLPYLGSGELVSRPEFGHFGTFQYATSDKPVEGAKAVGPTHSDGF